MTIAVPPASLLEPCARGVLGALGVAGGPTPLQLDLLAAVADAFGATFDVRVLDPLPAAELAAAVEDPALRHLVVDLMIALELVVHPLAPALQRNVERYARALGVHEVSLEAARHLAHHHVALLHADLLRHSWYTEATIEGMERGRIGELLHSKASYFGAPEDAALARRWRALGDLPSGTWGRSVFEFYRDHDFPLPGERHGIYEVGALHDWVHVLAGYGTDAEGEIDVFTFIAGTMHDPHGFVLFLVTLCLFQNASIHHVGGKRVAIARADTLEAPGAATRWAEAIRRSMACTVDVMAGIDHFSLADRDLEGLRAEWCIPPRQGVAIT